MALSRPSSASIALTARALVDFVGAHPARAVAVTAALAIMLTVAGGHLLAQSAHAQANDEVWVRPVSGGVVRPFAEPAGTYGPGHRGVDLAAAPGTPVASAGRGTVTFAGDVAGALHVVVHHRGDVRTSYSFLSEITVAEGDELQGGAVLGRSGGTDPADPSGGHRAGVLHFGVRIGIRYVDPSVLFRPADLRALVRLVPVDDGEPADVSWGRTRVEEEEAWIADGLAPEGGEHPTGSGDDRGCGPNVPIIGAAVDAVCAGVDWAAARTRRALGVGLALLGDAGQAGRELAARLGSELDALLGRVAQASALLRDRMLASPLGRTLADVVEIGDRFLEWTGRECSGDAPPADGTGGSGHLVMGVAGIDSASSGPDGRSFGLDVSALGYHRDEVHWFSYADDAGVYDATDTHGDLRAAAKRLATQLRAMDAADPGREVDLVAHSQGGVVVEQFLRFEYDASDPTFPPIGTVVTLASPHQGAPLATTAGDLAAHRKTRRAVDLLDRVLPGPPTDATSVRQLDESSPFMERLRAAPLPEHIELTTIGGTDDFIVPANRIRVPGATEVVVAVDGWNDHTAIHHDDRALQAVRAALERRPPPCTSFLEGLRGAVTPVLFSRVEGDLGEYLTTYLEVGR